MQRVILNIPHASKYIPIEDRKLILLNDVELAEELEHSTDKYSDELFIKCNKDKIIDHRATVSRLVCDTERFLDPAIEEMEAVGRGIAYWNGLNKQLRKADTKYREYIVEKYYKPYHDKLDQLVAHQIRNNGNAIILDCHTFNSKSSSLTDLSNTPVEICLGTSSNTPVWLIEAFEKGLGENFEIYINNPYSGCMIPYNYIGDTRVSGIMLECNTDRIKGERLKILQNSLVKIIDNIVEGRG